MGLAPAPQEHPVDAEMSKGHQEHDEHIHREVFDVTCEDLLRSPKPAWNHFTIRLPRTSHPVDPVAQKRLRAFTSPAYPRTDIFCFVPPLDGSQKRGFQMNGMAGFWESGTAASVDVNFVSPSERRP